MVVVDVGIDVARTNRIHIDAVTGPFNGHGFGHLHHGGFAHAIHADLGQHTQRRRRSDVDDASSRIGAWQSAFGPCQHAFTHRLSDEKSTAYIGVEDEVEVFFFHVQQTLCRADARVVDQDIDRSYLGFSLFHGRFYAEGIGDIQTNHMRLSALRLYVNAQRFQSLLTPACQNHRSTRTCQGLGKLSTQATGSASDECDASG